MAKLVSNISIVQYTLTMSRAEATLLYTLLRPYYTPKCSPDIAALYTCLYHANPALKQTYYEELHG